MRCKRFLALLIAAILAFTITACDKAGHTTTEPTEPAEDIVLEVYAPEELMAVMTDLAYRYSSAAPRVSVRIQYDEGAILAAKIEAGAPCDIFVSDEASFMDWLDAECGEESNPNRNDKIVSDTRADFIVGAGNPAYAQEELAEDEVYTTTYSAAVCRATAKPYEAGRFLDFILSDDVRDAYEAYGFTKAE